jgi:hypothetical protein
MAEPDMGFLCDIMWEHNGQLILLWQPPYEHSVLLMGTLVTLFASCSTFHLDTLPYLCWCCAFLHEANLLYFSAILSQHTFSASLFIHVLLVGVCCLTLRTIVLLSS